MEEVANHILLRSPTSLYSQCLHRYVSKLNYNVKTLERINDLRTLPPTVLADIYTQMSRTENLHNILFNQLCELDIFASLLRFGAVRQNLFVCLSTLVNHGIFLARDLAKGYVMYFRNEPKIDITADPCEVRIKNPKHPIFNDDFNMEAIDFGMRLGSFLAEAGWLTESIHVLSLVASRIEHLDTNKTTTLVRLDCLQRLLHSEAAMFSFKTGHITYKEINDILEVFPNNLIPRSLLANIYTQFAALYFSRSEYDKSHESSMKALKFLNKNVPERIIVDVLRQAAKACVVKREFHRANLLICQAIRRAKATFGCQHQKYADTLLDYGFFLLNVDSVYQSVNVYKISLSIKQTVLGFKNFHVAIAHEDLSYAYYVFEYSSGNFLHAREHVEKAVEIMKDLVPRDHLMLASAKRVKALLLEEIALDKMTVTGTDEEGLLQQSEELHKCALQLALQAFGEINVQTAKHYGNLGRLYQTMGRFTEAEEMHQRAIKIKTDLLGPCDYEVGLSIGHLASLYNYHMEKYREAEELYLRSISISIYLFGKAYSGLEYDYLGLCHVYETLQEFEKYLQYATILENWVTLRGPNLMHQKPTYPELVDEMSIEDMRCTFFRIKTQQRNGDRPKHPDTSSNSTQAAASSSITVTSSQNKQIDSTSDDRESLDSTT